MYECLVAYNAAAMFGMHPFPRDNVKTDLHVITANDESYNEILWLALAYSGSFHGIHRRQMRVISLYTSWTLKLQEEFTLCGSHFSFVLVRSHTWDLKTRQWHKTALLVTFCCNKLHVPHTKLKHGFSRYFYSAYFTFLKFDSSFISFYCIQNTAWKLYLKKISFWDTQ